MAKKIKNQYVVYIGTTKVCVLKARTSTSGEKEVVALSAKLANGFERGVVKDLVVSSETLAEAVKDIVTAEEEALIPCRVVVSNAYLKTCTFQSSLYFQDRPHALTLRDVRGAIAQTRSVATIPLQEVIVQAIPQSYLVNDLDGIRNPLGLEAGRLGVTLRLLTLDFLVHSNLLKVFERCELEVVDIIPSVLSAADVVLKESEKQEGVILVVVGGRVIHLACYKSSVLVDMMSISIGADRITQEIAEKLNVDFLDAQRIKERFGSAVSKREFQDELIPIADAAGHTKYHIRRAEFESKMSLGVEGFFSELKQKIKLLQERHAPLTQLVLTGGGVKLDGFLERVKEEISPLARIGAAQNIVGPDSVIGNTAFSSVIGGIGFTTQLADQNNLLNTPRHWLARTVNQARDWVFEYF